MSVGLVRRASGGARGGEQQYTQAPDSPANALAKWRSFRDRMREAWERLGVEFSQYGLGQLAVAESVVEDLEVASQGRCLHLPRRRRTKSECLGQLALPIDNASTI